MNKLLLIIDYQADFAAPDGILSAGPAALAIEPYLIARAEEYLQNGDDIAFTLDAHDSEDWAQHPESGSFPIHCVRGSSGYQIYGALGALTQRPNVTTLEKRAYCPEFSVLEDWVGRYEAIEITGLVTNICVLHTAIGLYTAKVNARSAVRLSVPEAGCASFDAQGHAFALAHIKETLGL